MSMFQVDSDIILRELQLDDATALYDILSEESSRIEDFVQVQPAAGVSGIQSLILRCQASTYEGRGIYLGIIVDGALSGQIRLELQSNGEDARYETFVCKVGYWLAKNKTGRGITYRCLRFLIPRSLYMHWSTRTILGYEAEINSTNQASQRVVERLGFVRSVDSSPRGLVFDTIAPHAVYKWVLAVNDHLESDFCFANESYRHCAVNENSSNQWLPDLLTYLTTEVDKPDQDDQTDQIELRYLAENLTIHRKALTRKLLAADPSRSVVPIPNFHQISDTHFFNGVWTEAGSDNVCYIVVNRRVVRGIGQKIVTSARIGTYDVKVTSNTQLDLHCIETGHTLTWTLIARYPYSVNGIDGIWKTPLGYAGVIGDLFIKTPDCWEMNLLETFSQLRISEQYTFSAEILSWKHVEWRADNTPTRIGGKRNRRKDVMSWSRQTTSPLHNLLVSSLRHYAALLLLAWSDRTVCEIQLLQQVTQPTGRWERRSSMTYLTSSPLDEILYKHDQAVRNIKALQNSFEWIRNSCNSLSEKIVTDQSSAFLDGVFNQLTIM